MSLSARIDQTVRRHGGASIGRRQQTGSRAVIPPPTGGLNTRDPFADMAPKYAIFLDNFFPDHGAVRLRKGSRAFATGVGSGFVETLIPHYSGEVAKFFAIGGGDLYEITPPPGSTGVTAHEAGSSLKSGISENRWSLANIGGHTVLVNAGPDAPFRIEPAGTVAAGHGWTGLDASALAELATVTPFKNRLFFTRKNSPFVYYGPLNGVQGELTGFDLSYVAPEGGNLLQIGTMTIDSGSGIDDLILFFMQHGVALLYRGIDPASSAEDGFFLIGKFKIGEIVGDRPLVNVGGDLFAHTVDGIMSMSELLKRGRSGQKGVSVSDAIAPSIRDQAALHGSTPGWDSILHPPASWLIFSAPVTNGEQYVMNTQTGAWTRFIGMDARCWGRFDDKLYFGGPDGSVYEAAVGADDAGSSIPGDVRTAYNYLRTPQDKRITMARSVVEADAAVQVRLGATTDFGAPALLAAPSSIVTPGGVWDEAVWDEASWAGTAQLREWKTLNEIGAAVSIRMKTETRGASVALFSTDIVYESAPGIL